MKNQKGYTITTFEVKVKHRTGERRKWLRQDLVETMRDRDEIKAVRAKVQMNRKPHVNSLSRSIHDNGWDHGFIYALAQVSRIRGDYTLVEELLKESGISIDRFKKVEPYDLKEVKAAIKRNNKYR